MKDWAARFADQLLKDNLQLEEFQVSLIEPEHFDAIVARLQEMGCEVHADKARRRLTVIVPRGGAGGGRSKDQPADTRNYRPDEGPRSFLNINRDEAQGQATTVAQAIMALIHLDGNLANA